MAFICWRNCIILTGILALALKASALSKDYSIDDCFKLARERSTTLSLSADQIDQTDAQLQQARAGNFPTLSLQASTTQQEASVNPIANSLTSPRQSTSNINLSQNLFHGFKDTANVNQRKNLKTGFELEKKQLALQLYKNLAQAFYSILIFQSDVALYNEQIVSTNKRKSELSAAKKSGRARDSDILSAESSIASLEAAVSRTKALLVSSYETFSYLTGLSKDINLVNKIRLPTEVKTVDFWLQKLDQRPDIQQSKSNMLAAEEEIRSAKAGYLPTLGLSANYYLSRPAGIFQGVNWDTSLTLSFPLFSGGLTKAQVSAATINHHSKEILVRQNQELAIQTIKTTVGTVMADFDQLSKLSNAADLSRRSYELVHRDNHLGVATNTDVLMALQAWQEAKRNLERCRITTNYDYLRLLVETSQGIGEEEFKLEEPNE